jgi:hypothetical protein
VAEAAERRAGPSGTRASNARAGRRAGKACPKRWSVRKAAGQRKKEKFTALLRHISPETLEVAFYALKRKAAPGVDCVTWQEYEADLERNLVFYTGYYDLKGRKRDWPAAQVLLKPAPSHVLVHSVRAVRSC